MLSVLIYYQHCLQVHRGFYTAYHNTTIRDAVLEAVERAKKFYGDIQIIATGHSMGGAMAAFCGLDLVVTITIIELSWYCTLSFCRLMLLLTSIHLYCPFRIVFKLQTCVFISYFMRIHNYLFDFFFGEIITCLILHSYR